MNSTVPGGNDEVVGEEETLSDRLPEWLDHDVPSPQLS